MRDDNDCSLDHFPDLAAQRRAIGRLLEETPTPTFVGEKRILIDRVRRLDHALAARWPSHAIAYSFKTNYQVPESGLFRQQGVWAEVVSGREYRMARELGYRGGRIVFNGPYKARPELERALDEGATINVNDAEELERLVDLVTARSGTQRIGIRVGSNEIGQRRPTRFGFSLDNGEASEAVSRIRSVGQLELAGIHMHLLGDTDDPEIYRRACRRVGAFVRDHVEGPLSYVDMGGGFPAHGPKPRSRTAWSPRPIEEYVAAITEELAPFFPDDKPTLILEPGRYLVADGLVLVTRLIRTQVTAGSQTLVSNGAITMLPLIHYCPQVTRLFSADLEPIGGESIPTVIHGSSCREDDLLYEGRLPRASVGNHLVHYAVGAYNANLSPDFIFETPPLVLF